MLDLHTHILPAMDDGSRDVDETIKMLAAEKEAGVTRIALTPHFYARREDPDRFLRRRAQCLAQMQADARYPAHAPKRLLPGAEIAYFEGVSRVEGIERLCIGDTRALLIEMPFCRWNERMLGEIRHLKEHCGLQPVLAHVERYLKDQAPNTLEEMADSGIYMQVNASFFLHWQTRRRALGLLENGRIHFIGSDCHNMQTRRPNMGEALQVISRKAGRDALRYLQRMEQTLLEGTL